MAFPKDLKYTKNDEWIRVEGDQGTIGISDYAQGQLSDIVFFETTVAIGEALAKGATCATVESVKAAAEVYLPVKGTVTAVNEALPATPELVNSDPFGGAWMVKIKIGDLGELASLLDAAAYEAYCQEQGDLMAYIPHTDDDRRAMLQAVGVAGLDDLYQAVPEKFRFPDLDLPEAIAELEAAAELQALSEANLDVRHNACFLGAGAYHHFIPSAVDAILRRSEFYTAYTPYQPEVAQGTLQAIFEYQSLICNLTGMDVSNASHYDGATALAEAVILALNHHRGKRHKILLSPAVHPHYRETVRTYMQGMDVQILGDDGGSALPADLSHLIDSDTAMVAVQYPDFFGGIADHRSLGEAAHAVGALLCVVVNPLALGLLRPPSDFDADVVVGEGQPLGIPLSFGGPYLGHFTTKKDYVRKMAGRLVGETVDSRGQRGFVLTLTPREQHIRREKATSNICTNVALMALASAVYLSVMGRQGLRRVAELCYHKAHYAAAEISRLPGYRLWNQGDFFHEFVVACPRPVADLNEHLLEHEIIGGYDLGADYPALAGHMLIAVTEMNSKDEIDDLVAVLEEATHD